MDSDKIERWDVPENMESLLTCLHANSGSLANALSAWEFLDSLSQRHQRHPGLDKSVSPGPTAPGNALLGWQFDANIHVIEKDWNTMWSVVPGSVPRLICASDANFGAKSMGPAEATMNIFGPLTESMGGGFGQAAISGNSLKSAELRSFSGLVWFPTIQSTAHQVPWIVALQHRNGPLQAVAYRVRERNRTISALVLLLLAATMGFVTVAGIREQKFAKLQMGFVASVAHELRTPLTAIFSAGENIKDGFVTLYTDSRT